MRLIILIVHGLWLTWMIGGAVLALLGFRFRRLWAMPFFRTSHLIALLATASVPLWNRGICPLTDWESAAADPPVASLLSRICEWLLYWDAPPAFLSGLTAAVAILTLTVYIWHPPWRPTELQATRPKVGAESKSKMC